MRAYPVLLEPLLFYVLHRVVARIQDPSEAAAFKLCVLDEAWRFIQHPTLRAYVQDGLKTWRKHNAAMILATQTVDDFASVDLLRSSRVPNKLLWRIRRWIAGTTPNCSSSTKLDLLTGLIRVSDSLKRPDLAKVLTLAVDPKSYWITNTPIDNAGSPRRSVMRLRGGSGPPRSSANLWEVLHARS
jgi:type IV secretion system protein VirB4